MAAYLEQSTRYIYFDSKNALGNYKYYVPQNLSQKTLVIYKQTMDQLFEQYSKLVHNLTRYVQSVSTVPDNERDGAWKAATRAQACDAARPILPVATTSTVGIFGSGQAIESLIMHLQSDRLSEARQVGEQILKQARKVMPAFLERADKPDRGGAIIAYRANTYKEVDEVVKKYLKEAYTQDQPAVQLVDYWPKNELDIVPDIIYEHSNLSLSEIENIIAGWPYERKLEIFKAFMGERLNRRHRPGRALEKVHYSWDLICDYGIFRDLQRHRMVDDLEWQILSPRFGYDTPKLVEQAGESQLFDQSFDTSLQLHSLLIKDGYDIEAQYATLLGHKMRWKVTYNAREAFHLHEIRTSPQGHPGYRKLVQQMHEKVGEVHPLLAESMKFVNQGEDPELTRLAAERYTQFKLKGLS
jgi:thymidylate synthase ThyX